MHRRALFAVIAVGFVLRVAWVLFAARTPIGSHDPAYYLQYGERIANGLGYTTPSGDATAYYPVGYPALLGVVEWIAQRLPGEHLLGAALALNIVAGTAAIGLIGLLGERIFNRRTGTIAATVVALLPSFVFHTAAVLSETVFNAMIAGALLVLCWKPWREPWSTARTIGAAALVAGAALIRPVALVLVPVVLIAWWLGERRVLPIRRSVIFVVAVLAVLAPWLARNWSVSGRPTLAASTGDNLCIGNNPDATGAFNLSPSCFGDVAPETFITGTDGRDAKLTGRALRWAAGHLSREPSLVLWRTYYTFENDHEAIRAIQSYGEDQWLDARHEAVLSTIADAGYFALLGLAALGAVLIVRTDRRDDRARFVLWVAASFVVALWPFFGEVRFHFPVVLALTIPAAIAVARVLDR
jgi:4-amino-4-deoxy-L-arabinose transferase-like glycosyltransferase